MPHESRSKATKRGVACNQLSHAWLIIEPGNAGLATKCHGASDKLSSAECHTCSTLVTDGRFTDQHSGNFNATQTQILVIIYVCCLKLLYQYYKEKHYSSEMLFFYLFYCLVAIKEFISNRSLTENSLKSTLIQILITK